MNTFSPELKADTLVEAPLSDESLPEEVTGSRSLSPAALASALLALLGLFAWMDPLLVVLPLAGLFLGFRALGAIRREPEAVVGVPLAKFGIALSAMMAIAGPARHTYQYVTEVPPDHDRASYEILQPDPSVTQQAVPQTARELNGKKIFIKGYMYPGARVAGITSFLLVRDKGDCCFGGNPKLTDRILVKLRSPNETDFTSWLVAISGTFHVDESRAGNVYYHLDEARVE